MRLANYEYILQAHRSLMASQDQTVVIATVAAVSVLALGVMGVRYCCAHNRAQENNEGANRVGIQLQDRRTHSIDIESLSPVWQQQVNPLHAGFSPQKNGSKNSSFGDFFMVDEMQGVIVE